MKWFKGLVVFPVDVCVCVAHVMMLGPRRPVLSWMLEIFRAMAMSGPSTTCSQRCTSSLQYTRARPDGYCVSEGVAKGFDAKSDKGQTLQRLFRCMQGRYLENMHGTKRPRT